MTNIRKSPNLSRANIVGETYPAMPDHISATLRSRGCKLRRIYVLLAKPE
jgi:hypothetical protein